MAALLALACAPRRAAATVADGTLITNMATATFYADDQGQSYSVSYGATCNVLIAGPDVQFMKTASPTVACSGSTVTFCITAVNNSPIASAFNLVLKDVFPNEWYYVNGQTSWSTSGTINVGYLNTFETIYTAGEPPTGQALPFRLAWGIPVMGPKKSAMVCFKATVL
jgi:uncharacterized repeat protein (TIGR01451 family)